MSVYDGLLRRGRKYFSMWPLWLEISSRYSNFCAMKITWDVSSVFGSSAEVVLVVGLCHRGRFSHRVQVLWRPTLCFWPREWTPPACQGHTLRSSMQRDGCFPGETEISQCCACIPSFIKCLTRACEIGILPIYSSAKCILTVIKAYSLHHSWQTWNPWCL